MKPGARINFDASKVFVPGGIEKEPIATMRSPLTAISPKAAIFPVPSIISPDLRTKSASMGSAARRRRAIKGRIMGKSLKIRDKSKGVEGFYLSGRGQAKNKV
jgi:hypothetical protein